MHSSTNFLSVSDLYKVDDDGICRTHREVGSVIVGQAGICFCTRIKMVIAGSVLYGESRRVTAFKCDLSAVLGASNDILVFA
jgi:hypothetical protein